MNPPTDREFGRLEGKVDALGERFTAFESRSSTEHAETNAALEKLSEKIDSLEATRDRQSGFLQAGALVKGAFAALLTFVGMLIGQGKTP